MAELDGVISDIRTTIFDLQTDPSLRGGLRAGVLQLTVDAGERLGFSPRVRFDGPVDTAVDREAGEQLLTVLRESLSNVIRHAGATEVEVQVSAGTDLVLVVADDGIGSGGDPEARRGFGLRNMETRAAALGGTFALRRHEPTGTLVEWRVPLATIAARAPRHGAGASLQRRCGPLAFLALRTRIATELRRSITPAQSRMLCSCSPVVGGWWTPGGAGPALDRSSARGEPP